MRKINKDNESENTIKLNEDTDYRYVSPLNAEKIDLSMINHVTNFEFLNEAQPDDRTPDYRDPIIMAQLKCYAKYLELHRLQAIKQWDDIKNGAAVQANKVQAEIDYIDSLNLDELL